MTSENNKTVDVNEQIEVLLKEKPDIFTARPDLLELINISDSRGTASLLEKQIEQLKTRLVRLKKIQKELIEVAHENDRIYQNLNKIGNRLIGYTNLSEFAGEFPGLLKSLFDIDEVSFKTSLAVSQRDAQKEVYNDVIQRLSHKKAVCDNRWPSSLFKLFFSDKIKSAALIPLLADPEQEAIGVLALGAKNAERYSYHLATDQLNRLGEMTGICLRRLHPSETE